MLHEAKKALIKKYSQHEHDSGSVEVQIAILTHRINDLTEHLKTHKKDNHSRTGLYRMVGKRRKLLFYLQKKKPEVYQKLLKELKLRK